MKDSKNKFSLINDALHEAPFKVFHNESDSGNETVQLNQEVIFKKTIKEDPAKGFELIFTAYYKPLCSHAVRFVYSKEIAEDIVEEVFLNFWKRGLYNSVNTSYRSYLYTAVRNSAFNYLKLEFREKFNVDHNAVAEENGGKENDSPEAIMLLAELVHKVEKLISSFPPQCQKVFLLSRFEGKKNREIADELDIKLKTVEAHMMKALGLLKKSLSDYLK